MIQKLWTVLAAACIFIACSTPLQGQSRAFHITGRLGVANPEDDYQSNCEAASMAFSLDVAGRRKIFPQVSFDHFYGSGGGDVACITDPALGTPVGGLRLEGSNRLGIGVGGRLEAGPLALEGVVSSGIVRGHYGYVASTEDDSRHVMPHVGGQASLIAFRFVVVSAAVNWTRLTTKLIQPSGGTTSSESHWSPMATLQVGLRIPAER